MTTDAYPLAWPPGWPRHRGARDSDSRFRGPTYRWDRVFHGLVDELRRIGAKDVVLVRPNVQLTGTGTDQRLITNLTAQELGMQPSPR